MSQSEKWAKAEWEFDNNPSQVNVLDPELGNIGVDVLLLIAPFEYSNGDLNQARRELAIKQGAFKPAPNVCD